MIPYDQDPIPRPHEWRIYANDHASVWAVVDEEDYLWAIRWRWGKKFNSDKKKIYLYRHSRKVSIYLHKEICHRAHGDPPTEKHIIGDHRNGDSLDCQRHNLRWATLSQNRRNTHGSLPYDFLV